jgi:polyisoprenoid-binding protein YceI
MKKYALLGFGVIAAVTTLSVNAANETWTVLPADTLNVMTVESETALENFTGRTNKVSGSIVFDRTAKTGSGTIMVDGASIDTGVAVRNEHMRSANWFNFDKSPQIKFATTSVRNTQGDTYAIAGDLTLNGVTKRINTTATVKLTAANANTTRMGIKGDALALSTKFKITLADYNIKSPAIDGGQVSNTVEIALKAIASNK